MAATSPPNEDQPQISLRVGNPTMKKSHRPPNQMCQKDVDKMLRQMEHTIAAKVKRDERYLESKTDGQNLFGPALQTNNDDSHLSCASFDRLSFAVSRCVLYSVRDHACANIHKVFVQGLNDMHMGDQSHIPEPHWFSKPADKDGRALLDGWTPFPTKAAASFGKIQSTINELEGQFQRLVSHMHKLTIQCAAENDPVHYVGATLINVFKRRREILDLQKKHKKQLHTDMQAVRVGAVNDLIMGTNWLVKVFEKDVADVGHSFRLLWNEITEKKFQVLKVCHNEVNAWKLLVEEYLAWTESASDFIPAGLRISHEALFKSKDRDNEEEEFLAPVSKLKMLVSYTERIISLLDIQSIETEAPTDPTIVHHIQKKLTQCETEIRRMQDKLKQIQKGMAGIEQRRTEYFSAQSVGAGDASALQAIESEHTHMVQLRTQTKDAIDTLGSTRDHLRGQLQSASEKAKTAQISVALKQAQKWKVRLEQTLDDLESQKVASQKQSQIDDYFRMKTVLHQETLATLKRTFQSTVSKLDAIATQVCQQAAQKIQQLVAAYNEQTKATNGELSLTGSSMEHYKERLCMHVGFSDALKQGLSIEKSREECHEKTFSIQMMSETVKKCQNCIGLLDEWKSKKVD